VSILCTMPGRSGDIIWALPTVRAISETYGESVDFVISQKYGSLTSLLERQAYLGKVTPLPAWDVRETAPMTPRTPPLDAQEYDRVFHLGYEGWPTPTLPEDIYHRTVFAVEADQHHLPGLDLTRPWITAPYSIEPSDVCVGFTDEHFELKFGLLSLLRDRMGTRQLVNLSNSPRWNTEGRWTVLDASWETAAAWLGQTQVFVGCCSALHVLAVAMGTPVVCVEPNPQRHQPVFYPLGKEGPVRLLLGGDGLPTVDARHLGDAVVAIENMDRR
jgi:hypothetical protein